MLPLGVVHARRHRVKQHRATMIGLFVGALIVAGIFTLLPGRIMHDVVCRALRLRPSLTVAAHRIRLAPPRGA